ncbi:LppU/SCO3897 family protein [Nocardia sp. X0981]
MTEPVPDEDGAQPLSPQDKRARVGATAAAIGIAAVVTSIVLGIGVAALLATAGGEENTEELAAPSSTVTTATGSSTTAVPVAPAGPSSAPAPSSAPTTTPSALGTAGQANKEAKEAPPKVEVVAGDCVSGFGEKEVTEAPCGSDESRYKVASAGPAGTACPTDADTSHTIADTTLCLDIDWVIGSCVDVSGEQPQRTECGPGGVRVISILPETNSVNACPSADRGFVYDERRFVVCFADI